METPNGNTQMETFKWKPQIRNSKVLISSNRNSQRLTLKGFDQIANPQIVTNIITKNQFALVR